MSPNGFLKRLADQWGAALVLGAALMTGVIVERAFSEMVATPDLAERNRRVIDVQSEVLIEQAADLRFLSCRLRRVTNEVNPGYIEACRDESQDLQFRLRSRIHSAETGTRPER